MFGWNMSWDHHLLSMSRLVMISNILVPSLGQWSLTPIACPASCLLGILWLLGISWVYAQQVWHPLWDVCGKCLGISQFLQINLGMPWLDHLWNWSAWGSSYPVWPFPSLLQFNGLTMLLELNGAVEVNNPWAACYMKVILRLLVLVYLLALDIMIPPQGDYTSFSSKEMWLQ